MFSGYDFQRYSNFIAIRGNFTNELEKNKTLFIPVVNLYKNEPEHLLLHSAQIYNLKYQFIPLQF